MKTIRMTVATLVAVLGLSTLSYAQTTAHPVTVVATDAKKFQISTPATATDVALIDADGTVLYRGSIKQLNKRGTAFNVATLPDGQYFLTATNDQFWFSQGISISNNRLTVNEKAMQEAIRPTLIAYDQNKFEVTMPVQNVSPVKVAIFNDNDELVFADTISQPSARRFNLAALPAGDYTVLVGPDQKQFSQRIAVRK